MRTSKSHSSTNLQAEPLSSIKKREISPELDRSKFTENMKLKNKKVKFNVAKAVLEILKQPTFEKRQK
jgi:hypothetical protein